jgi:hypothetical protein
MYTGKQVMNEFEKLLQQQKLLGDMESIEQRLAAVPAKDREAIGTTLFKAAVSSFATKYDMAEAASTTNLANLKVSTFYRAKNPVKKSNR